MRKVYLWGVPGIVETSFEYGNGTLITENLTDMAFLCAMEHTNLIIVGSVYHILYGVSLQDDPVCIDDVYTVAITYESHDIQKDLAYDT
jgi:hypothetical protein